MGTPCYIINSFIFIKRKSQKLIGGIFRQIGVFKEKPPSSEGGKTLKVYN